jgi:hypothetical protein
VDLSEILASNCHDLMMMKTRYNEFAGENQDVFPDTVTISSQMRNTLRFLSKIAFQIKFICIDGEESHLGFCLKIK